MGVKKHSEITNQTELHVPKHHKDSHKLGGTDELELNDLSTSETTTTKILQPTGSGKTQWNTNINIPGSITSSSTISTALGTSFNIGNPSVDGSWRMVRNNPSGSNEFVIQRRESGSWADKASWPTSTSGLEVQSYVDHTIKAVYANSSTHFCSQADGGTNTMYDGAMGNPAIDSTYSWGGSTYASYHDDFFEAWRNSGSHMTHSNTEVYSVRASGFWNSSSQPGVSAYLWKFNISNNAMSASTFSLVLTCVGKVDINPATSQRSFNITGSTSSVVIPAGYGFFWTMKNSSSTSGSGVCNLSAKILVP